MIKGNFSLQLPCYLLTYIPFLTSPSGHFHLFKLFLLLEIIATEFKHCLKNISYLIILL